MDLSSTSNALRKFTETHIDEDCQGISGFYENALFYGCTFNKLNGVTFKDCDLNGSKVLTDKVRDALGLTVTLDCNTFSNVELSPLMFDLMLCLLLKTKGNTEKRRKLLDVIGKDRLKELLIEMSHLE